MVSLRSVSRVASFAFAAFGLMGCAASSFQSVGQPRTGASVASSDASSLYQPSPNYRPLAVRVTPAGAPGVSPNARLLP